MLLGKGPDESCIQQSQLRGSRQFATFLSFLLITKSLHVPQEAGSPACGRKGMQALKDQLLMFGTLHILCGRPHVLCCPRDLYANLS